MTTFPLYRRLRVRRSAIGVVRFPNELLRAPRASRAQSHDNKTPPQQSARLVAFSSRLPQTKCVLKCTVRNISHIIITAALRLFRRIVSLKDADSEWYIKYITKHNLFEPIVETYRQNGHKYNLLNSALLELFEFIRAVIAYDSIGVTMSR